MSEEFAPIAQLVDARVLYTRGSWFESRWAHKISGAFFVRPQRKHFCFLVWTRKAELCRTEHSEYDKRARPGATHYFISEAK